MWTTKCYTFFNVMRLIHFVEENNDCQVRIQGAVVGTGEIPLLAIL